MASGGSDTNQSYDKDNTTSNSSTNQNSNTDPTSTGGPGAGTNTASSNNPNQGPIRPEHDNDKTGVTSLNQPSTAFSDNKPRSSNDRTVPGAQPSVSADPTSGSGVQDSPNSHQGAEHPHDEPTGEQKDAVRGSKEKGEAVQAGDESNNIDTSGPGPTPVSERKEGGAGAGGPPKSAGGDDDGPQKESHGEGTGEKWIKTSGMKADGGNFDASQAGAGKEADRLLEEKGVHHTAPGEPTAGKEAAAGGKGTAEAPTGKRSLGQKIKAKLGK